MGVAACSAPGSNNDVPTQGSTGNATSTRAAPTCGTDPVTLKTYIETGFPLPKALSRRVHEAVPERDLRHPRGPVRGHHPERPPRPGRRPAGPDAPAADVRAGQGRAAAEPRPVRRRRSAGTSGPPRSSSRCASTTTDVAASGPLYAMGLNSVDDRRVLQQEARGQQIGMTEAPTTPRRARRLPAEGQGRRHRPDRPVQRRRDRRSRLPAAEPHGRLRHARAGSTTGSSRSRARRSTPPTTCKAAEHLDQWIKAGYFADDVNSLDYATMMSRFIGGRACSSSTATGSRATSTSRWPGNVGLLPDAVRHAGRARRRRDVRAADLRHLGEGGATPTAPRSSSTGSATDEKARTIGVEIGGSHPMGPADAYMPTVDAEHRDGRDPRGRREDRRGQRRDGLHRQRDGCDLRQELDAATCRSWSPGSRRPQGLLTRSVQADYESEIGG